MGLDREREGRERLLRTIDRTGAVIVTLGTSLLVILLTVIAPLSGKLARFETLEARAGRSGAKANATASALERRANALKRRSEATRDEETKKLLSREAMHLDGLRQQLRARSGATAAERAQLRKELINIPTPFGSMPFPTLTLPLVWLGMTASLTAFWALRRGAILRMAADLVAARSATAGSERPTYFVLDVPFWLAPLNSEQATTDEQHRIARNSLIALFGWRQCGRFQMMMVAGWAFVLLGACTWVLWLAFQISSEHSDPQMTLRVRVAAGVLVAAIGAILIATVWNSRRPASVRLLDFRRRRTLEALGCLVGGALVAYVAAPRKFLPSWIRADRRRSPPYSKPTVTPPTPRGVFLMHTSTGIVHYVGETGFHSDAATLTLKNAIALEPATVMLLLKGDDETAKTLRKSMKEQPSSAQVLNLDAQARKSSGLVNRFEIRRSDRAVRVGTPRERVLGPAVKQPRVNKGQLAAITECLSVDLLRAGKAEEAILLLDAGLLQANYFYRPRGTPPLRLYDLLARLFAEQRPSELAAFAERATRTWPNHLGISERARRWRTLGMRKKASDWKSEYRHSKAYAGLPVSAPDAVLKKTQAG